MKRTIFEESHEHFRQSVRQFVAEEVAPHHEQWEKDGMVSREVWLAAGKQGFLGMAAPEEFGGAGVDDIRYSLVLYDELAKVNATGAGFALQNDVVLPYLLELGTEEQKARWLPGVVTGEAILAIAMSEPGGGSDVAGVRTTAVRDGDCYVLNGSKTFISNGILNDLCVVVAKTDPSAGGKGVSLLVVERGMEGYVRGRNLDKVGMKAQDTSELFFNDVRVPVSNLLGEENKGFGYLMRNLAQERLTIAWAGLAMAEHIFPETLEYAKTRTAFGQPIGSFQNSRFKLAEMATELEIARTFMDRCVLAHLEGELTAVEAAMAKWWVTDFQVRLVDTCVQLHGGYGFMLEYPVAKAFIDSRAQTIYGGTNEIMKELIGRSLGV